MSDTLTRIADIVRADYKSFPDNQSYDIYDPDVAFKDPMTSFQGVEAYKKNIAFIARWFKNLDLQLHNLETKAGEAEDGGDRITTHWTLSWNTPISIPLVIQEPRITIPGRSDLDISADGLIIRHIDYWDCSKFGVLKQHFVQ